MRVTPRIILTASLSLLLMTAGSSLVVFQMTKSAVIAFAAEQQDFLAKNTLDKIDRLIRSHIVEMKIFSSDYSAIPGGAGKDPQIARRMFRNLKQVSGYWDSVEMADLSGRVLAADDGNRPGFEYSTDDPESAAIRAVKDGVPYSVSGVLIHADVGGRYVLIASPVTDDSPSRKNIGVVLGRFPLGALNEILEALDARAELIDIDGTSMISNARYPELGAVDRKSATGIGSASVSAASLPIAAIVSTASQSGFLEYHGSGWRLILAVPIEKFLGQIHLATARTALASAFIALISILLVLLTVRRHVLRPVGQLMALTSRAAAGDFSGRVKADGDGEMAMLGTAFNQMAAHIDSQQRHLESEVRKKTVESAQTVSSLKEKIAQIERTNRVMVDRELIMRELKRRLAESEGDDSASDRPDSENV